MSWNGIEVGSVADILGAMAFLITAIFAGAAYWSIDRRNRERNTVEFVFGLYQNFWDSDLRDGRRIIEGDLKYKANVGLIQKMLSGNETIAPNDEITLDSIDQVLAIINYVLISTETRNFSRGTKTLITKTFVNHWCRQIAAKPELMEYCKKYWPNLHQKIIGLQPPSTTS